MCITPIFHHTCGCSKPLEGGLERCYEAEEAKIERCDAVIEEVIEYAYPCTDCFEKQQERDVGEQVRAAMVASANDYAQIADLEVEEQMRAAMKVSANDFAKKTEEEVEQLIRVTIAASVADEAKRAQQQEEAEMEMILKKSMEGISLEARWEVDGEDMQKVLQETYMEYRKQQEDVFREKGLLEGDGRVAEGEWTKKETIHDRAAAAREGQKHIPLSDRPGPSRPGPAKAYTSQPQPQFFPSSYSSLEVQPSPLPPPPPPPTKTKTKRPQDYPPNISPSDHRHPLLYQYIGCYHDIPAGIDYNQSLFLNELNAIRKPMPGKCPKCGGKAPPPLNAGNEKEKAVETPELEVLRGNNVFPPEPESPVERELTAAEIRAKRLAMMEKDKQ